MSKLFNWAAARIVAAFALALPLAADAFPLLFAAAQAPVEAVNPVTGDNETYDYRYIGDEGTWTAADWEDAGENQPAAVPQATGSNVWGPLLIEGGVTVTSLVTTVDSAFEGWNFRVGLFNGADLTIPCIRYWNGDQSPRAVVDEDSYLTIQSLGTDTWTTSVDYYIAGVYGIWYECPFSPNVNAGARFNYYFSGDGSVMYEAGITTGVHDIRQADAELSGNAKSVKMKELIEYEVEPEVTFVATDAKIVLKGVKGTAVKYLTSLTVANETSLTTDDAVGTCELIQATNAVYLCWVDGSITDVENPVYQPSINVNFTQGTALSAGADVGVAPYAVPGTSWNNLIGNNGSLATVTCVDTTGAATEVPGASVTISGTRGYWGNGNVSAANDLRNGYIDDRNNGSDTPTVVVEGIPYYSYKVVAYFSNNDNNVQFGYLTLNGVNYKGDNGATVECNGEATDKWGASSTSAYAEGGNYLVSPTIVNKGGRLTVVSHDLAGCRAGLAAIQIVEVKPEAGENELVIDITGTRIRQVDADAAYDKVYVTGQGTLSFTGAGKITTKDLDVSGGITLAMDAEHLDVTNVVTGCGTVVYDGLQPSVDLGFDDDAWSGTVWVKNIGSAPDGETQNTAVTLGFDTTDASQNTISSWGNANSYVKFTNVRGHVAAANCPWTLVLEDGTDTYAWYNNNGWTGRDITIAALEGDGTFYDQANVGCRQLLTFTEASNFTGSFNIAGKRIGLGGNNTAENNQAYRGTIEVASGKTVTVAAGKTWTTGMGFRVYGTINATGTLAADSTATACAVGTGTVVFGGVPSPTGDKWWKNAAWTGTVEIKGATALNGDYAFNDYGNSGSTLKLTNCTGWLKPNYTCVPALEIGGTFTWNDGSSGLNNTFKVSTLKGSGTISIPNQGAATAVWQITDDWSGFTGAVVGNNSAAKRVLVFGSTLPTTIAAGDIYISEGATLNLDNASSAWWGVGMRFVVDGTVKASARNKWGGGTGMTLGDSGILEFVSSSNTNDEDTNMSGITGTGTLKFSSSAGWRAFPKTDANMPATTLTIQTELADSLILPTKTNDVTVVGNLAGSKNIRSDRSNNGPDGRILTVTQSKNTEWEGKFVSNRTTQFNVVAPAEGTPGTLTLSGTQDATIPMQVGGAVNLTGTWKGATTVAGAFGGTGTLTGNLTFSDGATLKANASALTVSGTVTLPTGEGESLTIDAAGLDADEVTILSSESITTETDVSKVTVDGLYTVEAVAGALKLVSTRVEVTVPAINNATVTVSVGGETIGTEAGTYKVAPDAVVTATYAAEAGYEIFGQTVYTIDVSNSETTFDPAGTTEVKQYVAYVVFQQESGQSFIDVTNNYTTVSNAIDAAKAMKKTVVLIAQPEATDTYNIAAGETVNVKKGEFTFDGIIFPEGAQYSNTTTEIAGVTQYKCTVITATVQYPGQEPQGVTGQLIQILGGLYSGYVPGYAGTVVTVLDGSDSTVGDAMPDVFTYDSEAHTYTLKTMVASINTGAVDIYYPTISNAFEAVVSGQTIKVLCDNTSNVRSVRVKEGATVTLDLNGCTVTGPSEDNPMFWLEDNSNFVVTDTTEDKAGKLVSEASKVVWSNNRCTFTLTAGTLESTMDVPIYIYFSGVNGSRIVNINGGKLVSSTSSSSNGDFCIMNANGIVNMTAGEIVSTCGGIRGSESSISGGTITVNRGVFYNTENQRVTGGTFNKDVSEYVPSGYEVVNNGNGTYTVREDKGWVYAAPGYWNHTGTWSEGATIGADKVAFESNATYTASNPSAGQLVTVEMTLSFDDTNDDVDGLEDAKSAVRLAAGETDGTYQFQLYTSDGVNRVWTNATVDVTANKEVDYAFVFVLDLTNKTYTASIVNGTTTNAMTVGGVTNIMFACQDNVTAVQRIDFVGSGTVTSIKGSYETPKFVPGATEFVLSDVTTNITLTAKQADWLNACGSMSEVKTALAGIGLGAFDRAYLLNLNILDENYEDVEKPLSVTAFDVGDASVTVEVTLMRKGKLDGGINGTLKLTGAADLGSDFDDILETPVGDDDFSEGDTATWTFDKGSKKFFKPVIE